MKPLAEDDPREIGGFRLLGRLGEGGMGLVFVGRSRSGRLAAVKVLKDALSADRVSAQRFRREIKAAQAVSGAFTAPVLTAGPDDDPPWLATALSGPSLAEVVREVGPLPAPVVWRLAIGLAEVLENVHGHDYVHRDLKPANVLLDADGVKLIDFGVLRSQDSSITMAGVLIGTFDFMSPEQRRGQRAGAASDVFSLGCVVAFAAAGSLSGLPAAGTEAAVIPGTPSIRDVPEGLQDLVRACLAADPAARPTPSWLMAEATERLALYPSGSPASYWPEPVASFVGGWQRDLLLGVPPGGAAWGVPPGGAVWGSRESTVNLVPRTWPSPDPTRPARPADPTRPDGLGPLRADSPPSPCSERNPEAASRAAEGDLLRLRQRHADAADAYQASIDLDPSDPEVHDDLGTAYYALDRLADAERCFRRAIVLAPDYLAAHHNLCITLQADERFADAADAARGAIDVATDDPAGYENLGDALYRLDRPGDAADAYRRAAALDPGNPRLDGKLSVARRTL